MPGIDYAAVRARIKIGAVLGLAGFEAVESSGD